jgi:hypothetical protein
LADAVAHEVELTRPMRVAVDHELDARLLRHFHMEVGQVEPLGLGADLEQDAQVACRAKDLREIDGDRFTLADESGRRSPLSWSS